MSAKSPPIVFNSPPFFTAEWLGCHPRDHEPRMVECFGPSSPDDYASVQAAVLGLESAMLGNAPPATSLYAEVSNRRVVLFANGHELLWTEPLPEQILATLRQRPEILLVWVDIPLANPRRELSAVGIEHVWTGTAPVRGGVT